MAVTGDVRAPLDRPALLDRVAGAPISWGVCEVPGWGWQYDAATVLTQMHEIGLSATEFGPAGFLPSDPGATADLLAGYGLAAVGQFVPVVLHDPDHDPVPEVHRAMDSLVDAHATTLVLAAATGAAGYDARPVLGARDWATLMTNLDRIDVAAAARGVEATLHPHVGTVVATGTETDQVLAGSGIGLCLDTGHLLIGGADPVDLARRAPDRIRHVHLKDVSTVVAGQVRNGVLTYSAAVRAGLYRPLGGGDVDIAALVTALEQAGYTGWYVLEQDTVLDGDPADGSVRPPVEDVRASLEHLRAVAGALTHA